MGWRRAKSDLLKPLSHKGLLAFCPENMIFSTVLLDAPEIVLFALFWCILGYLLENRLKAYINKAFLHFSNLKINVCETVLHPLASAVTITVPFISLPNTSKEKH